ncbi:FmdB family zinc ribbon protein [Pseudorhodoferax soli]|jgi:putative FmdB family regulatory protein|uniref:Putative FmdB family regulatory protein n=1 Tax=Pseudorhodoferax soli TaxID=545864 RepID=A0A368YAY2_9BURK|nr:FmdB family zinc ribbon protein [Pseudorhodoferax soli]RCW75997.1 putative FmdB family regulatory protein [Pseudorhodoferax soli]
MPIYAYRCESCGHAKDVLQKISDAPLTQCPQCGADAFRKQVTAAGFQLKGSGWYVTDFRNNGSAPASAPAGKPDESAAAPAPASDAAASPAPAPAPAAAPAAASPAAPSPSSTGST